MNNSTPSFSSNAEFLRFQLSPEDKLGKSWNLAKWENLGNCKLDIFIMPEDSSIKNCYCVATKKDATNKETVMTAHLTHPETVLKTTNNGKGRMLWVQDFSLHLQKRHEKSTETDKSIVYKEVCIEVIFETTLDAERFESTYKDAQEKTEKANASTSNLWRKNYIEKQSEKSVVLHDNKRQMENVEQSDTESEFNSEDDDSSEVSEISLDSFSDVEKDRGAETRDVKFPSFKSQQDLWKCMKCTTPNPKDVLKCLCCEHPRDSPVDVEQKDPTKPSIFVNLAPKPTEVSQQSTSSKPSFNFSFDSNKSTSEKPSFNFGVTSFDSTSSSQPKSEFSFGNPPTTKTTAPEAASSVQKPAVKSASAGYPPLETLKKVEQMFPAGESKPKVEQKPNISVAIPGYPPIETLKKVDQEFGSGKDVKKAALSEPKSSNISTGYPPMETMKKVEQQFMNNVKGSSPFQPSVPVSTFPEPKSGSLFLSKPSEQIKSDQKPSVSLGTSQRNDQKDIFTFPSLNRDINLGSSDETLHKNNFSSLNFSSPGNLPQTDENSQDQTTKMARADHSSLFSFSASPNTTSLKEAPTSGFSFSRPSFSGPSLNSGSTVNKQNEAPGKEGSFLSNSTTNKETSFNFAAFGSKPNISETQTLFSDNTAKKGAGFGSSGLSFNPNKSTESKSGSKDLFGGGFSQKPEAEKLNNSANAGFSFASFANDVGFGAAKNNQK